MKNSRIFILACGIICSLIMGFAYTYSIVQPYIMDYFSIASYMASLPYTIFLALFVVGNYVGGVIHKTGVQLFGSSDWLYSRFFFFLSSNYFNTVLLFEQGYKLYLR